MERNKRATLDASVAKLNALVESSESSLAQEKDLVTRLQQEISQLKVYKIIFLFKIIKLDRER